MYIIYLLLIILIFGYKYLQFVSVFKDVDKFPGPKTIPILGNVLEFGGNSVEFLQNMIKLTKKFGSIFRVWLNPFSPLLIISDVKCVEKILSSSVEIKKSSSYDSFKLWLGNGIFTSDGQNWRTKRKLLTPTMHFKILESFIPIFISQSEVLVEKLKTAIGKEETLDIFPYINLFSVDNICETSMGISINAQDNPNFKYITAVAGFLKCHMIRQFSLFKRSNFFYKFTRLYVEQKKYVDAAISFTTSIIKQKKKIRENNQIKNEVEENVLGLKRKTALLELLLDMEEAKVLSEEDIREEVDTFMFGGHDTISSALSCILFELSKHPKIQQDILEEIKCEYDGSVCTSFLKKLHFTERVIKECMRLYPTVPYIERELTEDVKFNGIRVRAKTCIAIFIYGLHYNEENFPQPELFDPDRFLPENCAERNPYAYIPFSAGPRNCIGQKYSYFLMKICLVKILTNFEISAVRGFEPILKNDSILKSVNGFYITLKERKTNILT